MIDGNLFDSAFKDEEWCTCNMLVEPVDECFERLAAGCCTKMRTMRLDRSGR